MVKRKKRERRRRRRNEGELQMNYITCSCGDEREEIEMTVWRQGGCRRWRPQYEGGFKKDGEQFEVSEKEK